MDSSDQTNQSQPPGLPPRRGRGRPRIWPEDRRIPPVTTGRMSFRPGDAHQMDAQIDEARRLRKAIADQLAQTQALLVELVALDDASEAISREEQAITQLLWDMYGTRKHRDHIVATFIAARRRRLLQRLQAASAALEQAREFLNADAGMVSRLQQTLTEAQASVLFLHGPPPLLPTDQEAEEPGEEEADDEAEEDQDEQPQAASDLVALEEEQQTLRTERAVLLHIAGGGDDADATRAALAAFDVRMRTMRSAITEGRGWFEWYYIPRPKMYTEEAREYLAREEEIPPDVQKYEEDERDPWGPYLRYRWWEGKIKYSMGMGSIRHYDPTQPNKPPIL